MPQGALIAFKRHPVYWRGLQAENCPLSLMALRVRVRAHNGAGRRGRVSGNFFWT